MLPRTVGYLLLRFGPGPAPIRCREEGGSKQDLKEEFFRKTTLTMAKPVKEQNHWGLNNKETSEDIVVALPRQHCSGAFY